ncbi:MAG: ribonuclease HII [Candidatus Saccharimonadales bacterium]
MIGIDEVGRGAWAGPLLIVGSRRKSGHIIACKDSKMLTRKGREEIFKTFAMYYEFGEGWVSADEIDQLGLSNAMRLGVERVLKNLKAELNEKIIIDGNINYCPEEYTNTTCLVKADNVINEVSVASVFAKVVRDRYMLLESHKYPKYYFEKNVGYGTQKHRQALKVLGLTKIHRRSFAPMKGMIND